MVYNTTGPVQVLSRVSKYNFAQGIAHTQMTLHQNKFVVCLIAHSAV